MCSLWSHLRRSRRFANRDGDLTEKHHIIPRAKGGNDLDKNLELLHLHCHDIKHGTTIDTTELDGNPF
ncbi:HNH endonuclease signature motif containing protein [Moorena sp. SIO4E2]|uniref:HNH endonuclease n=1 Tax=Moorena sp. SIO4E2 TaxID=2607826 RepID=UPI00338E1682